MNFKCVSAVDFIFVAAHGVEPISEVFLGVIMVIKTNPERPWKKL